jgi:hypothetical protein
VRGKKVKIDFLQIFFSDFRGMVRGLVRNFAEELAGFENAQKFAASVP